MKRTDRIALVVVVLAILVAAGGVMANVLPAARDAASQDADDAQDAQLTADELAHAADRLDANGITVDEGVLNDLAARYGIGGAVRVLAWSHATETSVDEITAMRDGTDTEPGMGWGRIAHVLDVHPGIGSIMGKGDGHGREDAPGQNKASED